MEKATFVRAYFIASHSITHQGNRDSIRKYTNDGYYVKEHRNGFWVLVKSSAAMVVLENSAGQLQFNMREDILEYYGKQKLTQKLFDKFNNDASNGKIKFYMENGCYCLE